MGKPGVVIKLWGSNHQCSAPLGHILPTFEFQFHNIVAQFQVHSWYMGTIRPGFFFIHHCEGNDQREIYGEWWRFGVFVVAFARLVVVG